MIDSHTHLELCEPPDSELVAAAVDAGVNRIVTVGTDGASCRAALAAAEAFPQVYAAVGRHPNAATGFDDADLAELAALAGHPKCVAVGETGLDYYRDWAPAEVQREWFRAHIDIAKRTGRALVIHDREAHEDVLRILDEEGPPERVVFHCFSGDAAMAKRCAEAGYLMSFAGNVTFSSAQPLRDAAAAAPLELILVETDAPFLTPVPNRGKPNSPAMVAHTLRAIAEVKHVDVAELCGAVTAAGERAFGPWL